MKISKLIFYVLTFVICSLGCAEEEGFSYQLTDETLIDILVDLHISESATQHLSLNFRDSMSIIYLDQVLEIHEVPKEVFEPDYIKLKQDPQKLVGIYEKVIKRLDDLKSKKKKEEIGKGQESKQRTKKK